MGQSYPCLSVLSVAKNTGIICLCVQVERQFVKVLRPFVKILRPFVKILRPFVKILRFSLKIARTGHDAVSYCHTTPGGKRLLIPSEGITSKQNRITERKVMSVKKKNV